MEKEKIKVHMNDIKDDEIQRPVKVFIVGDTKYYADRTSKEQLSTHRDCEQCGAEFEKSYTYDKYCPSCKIQIDRDKYLKLPLVDWVRS